MLLSLVLECEQALPGLGQQRLQLGIALPEGHVIGDQGMEYLGHLIVLDDDASLLAGDGQERLNGEYEGDGQDGADREAGPEPRVKPALRDRTGAAAAARGLPGGDGPAP